MATLIQTFRFRSLPSRDSLPSRPRSWGPPFSIGRSSVPSSSRFSWESRNIRPLETQCRASATEGVPGELTELEDSKFAPLTTEEPAFGPPALLLLGFEVEETAKIKLFLKEMGGEFLKVIHCTEDMIGCSLWEAMHSEPPNLEDVKIAQSVPRVCFLSGLSGEEMMMFIDAYPEIGLEPAVFAALVPNSADKMLGEVIEEIMGDHEMMSAKQSE